jgi:hypothetical protein
MKRHLGLRRIRWLCLAGAFVAAAAISWPTDDVVFDLEYRGLEKGVNEEFHFGCWYGFILSKEAENDFQKNLAVEGADIAYFDIRLGATRRQRIFGAVARVGGPRGTLVTVDEPEGTIYLDLNGDGEVSEGETIRPWESARGQAKFVTPDFKTKGEDGTDIPFRLSLMLQGKEYLMGTAGYVFEGAAKVNGQDFRLVLLDTNMDGKGNTFGRDFCVLIPEKKDRNKESFQPKTLSKLLSFDGEWHTLQLSEDGKKATLRMNEAPLGTLEVSYAGSNGKQSEMQGLSLCGAEDPGIVFDLHGLDRDRKYQIPVGAYKAQRGSVRCRDEDRVEWQIGFSSDAAIEIKDGEETLLKLGNLKAQLLLKRQEGRSSEVVLGAGARAYAGQTINIGWTVVGESGEIYDRCLKISPKYQEVQPGFSVLDASGKQVASGSMQYG